MARGRILPPRSEPAKENAAPKAELDTVKDGFPEKFGRKGSVSYVRNLFHSYDRAYKSEQELKWKLAKAEARIAELEEWKHTAEARAIYRLLGGGRESLSLRKKGGTKETAAKITKRLEERWKLHENGIDGCFSAAPKKGAKA